MAAPILIPRAPLKRIAKLLPRTCCFLPELGPGNVECGGQTRRQFGTRTEVLAQRAKSQGAGAIDLEVVDINKALERVDKYREQKGRNRFVTGNNVQPFPLNPYFHAVPPVSDGLREKIYKQFSEDPAQWPPRKLAEEHGLSLIRVKAILKLKTLERKLADQGTVLQTELTKRIEAMLEAEDVRSDQYREAPRTRVSFRSTPVFMSADDYDPAMPEIFNTSRSSGGRDVSDMAKLTYEGSPAIKTKHRFLIHDISKSAVKKLAVGKVRR